MGRLPRAGMKPGKNVPTKFGQRELQDLDGLQSVLHAKSRSAAIRVAVAFALERAERAPRAREQLAELAALDSE